MKLYEVSKRRYQQVLKGYDDVFKGLESKVRVDKRGYSPEIGKEIGEDYIIDNVFVFSPKQSKSDLLVSEYSFLDDLMNEFYNDEENKKLISVLTKRYPLSFKIHLESYSQEFLCRLMLDEKNVKKAMKNLRDVRAKIYDLDEDTLASNEDYIFELVDEVNKLREIFGDIKDLDVRYNSVYMGVDHFTFYSSLKNISNGEPDGYALNISDTPTVVYFGNDSSINGSWFERLITIDPESVDSGKIYELFKAGVITLDENRILKKLDKMAKKILRNKGVDDPTDDVISYRHLKKYVNELPEEWRSLAKLLKGDFSIETDVDRVKLDYLIPTDNPYSKEILSRVKDIVYRRKR